VDQQMTQARKVLEAAQVRFQEGLNEDLAATALWGSQQAELRGEGRFDGVFGLWYGKGPGVDRTGDVFRHANMAGTSPRGGVLVAMGDDHTGESSTCCTSPIGRWWMPISPSSHPPGCRNCWISAITAMRCRGLRASGSG
jgi:TPP-dependent indolepyruvate ferredoxin oxidoreductase alpha subunit